MVKFFLILFGYVLILTCQAQLLTDNYYSKVVVEMGTEKIISVDSIYIDTLVLKDGSKLKFLQHSILVSEYAYIGDKCELNSHGSDGLNGKNFMDMNGEDGTDGKNLTLIMHFKELGNLNINTSGGRGGNGSRGRSGYNGEHGVSGGDGQKGASGGNGGKGGNLTMIYSYEGFIPIFNSERDNGIQFDHAGGTPGLGGLGGRGGRGGEALTRTEYSGGISRVITVGQPGRNGWNGRNGSAGRSGKSGELILRRIQD